MAENRLPLGFEEKKVAQVSKLAYLPVILANLSIIICCLVLDTISSEMLVLLVRPAFGWSFGVYALVIACVNSILICSNVKYNSFI